MQIFLRSLIAIGIFCVPFITHAQTPTVEYTVHYGDYGDGEDLTGFVTYDIYLDFTGVGTAPSLASQYGSFDTGPEYYLEYTTDCATFQHDQGGFTAEDVQCFLYDFFPSLEWDSRLTVGSECRNGADATLFTVTIEQPLIDAWENTAVPGNFFDGGTGFTLNQTAVFRLPPDVLMNVGPDNRILIARITTCGGVCFHGVYQYFPTGLGDYVETIQEACFDHPCLANPMDTNPAVGSVGCFGDATLVSFDEGGFENVDYTLYSGSTIGSGTVVNTYLDQTAQLDISGLPIGDYYMTMIDNAGCRDTSVVFTVTEPEELVLDAELVQDVLCFGENIGQIQVNCSGGTGDLTLDVNGVTTYQCGELISDLACGVYVITLTDENDCELQETINITCPTELVANLTSTDVPCFNYDNGTITGTISGGTGLITVVLSDANGDIETVTGTGSVTINFDELNGGTYTVTYSDANNCTFSEEFIIDEPTEEFSATTTPTDATCFGFCDGSVVFDIIGGTAPLTIEIFDVDGNVVNALTLCAGDHTWIITDDNDCTVEGTFIISSLSDITYEVTATTETCFGFCDGQIDLTNVAGSADGFTYTLSPNSGICTDPCSGSSANFNSLCDGTYTVTIIDQLGCEKDVTDIVIESPAEMIINLTPTNVTCFGEANGQVFITATGGTGVVTTDPDGDVLPFTVTDLAPSVYIFTIIDENGCTATDDVEITEPELLVTSLLETTDVGCGGACNGTATYEVVGGVTPYIFFLEPQGQQGAVNGTLGTLCAGDYELIITDGNDCQDTLVFTINEPEPLAIDVLLNRPTCTGMFDGSAIVAVSGGTGVLTTIFSPDDLDIVPTNDTTFTILNLGEGEFIINLFDENECSLRDTVEIVPDIITDMVLTLSTSPETCWNMNDGTATLAVQNGNPPITWEWDDPELQTTPSAVGLAGSTLYHVVVTDFIGCTLEQDVFIETTEDCFFISTALTPNGDGVNDVWLLGGLEYYPLAKIQVANRWGQIVFSSTGYNAPWDGTLEGELLPVADYYFSIEYSDEADPIIGTVTIKY